MDLEGWEGEVEMPTSFMPLSLFLTLQLHAWSVLVTGICTGFFFLWVPFSFYYLQVSLFTLLQVLTFKYPYCPKSRYLLG